MFFLYLKARARPKKEKYMQLTMQFEEETTNIGDGYWGLCPVCHKTDGCVTDVAMRHFYFCKQHKVRWCVGQNLFSIWMVYDAEQRERRMNEMGLYTFEDVKPYQPLLHHYEQE
jgi:hypothetical protein